MEDSNYWTLSTTIADGEKYDIEGFNIWEYKWINTGQYFFKKDPVRQINTKISVYEINIQEKSVKFGATEISNGAWIIYTHYK